MIGADEEDLPALDHRDRAARHPDVLPDQRRGAGGGVVEVFGDPVAKSSGIEQPQKIVIVVTHQLVMLRLIEKISFTVNGLQPLLEHHESIF